MTRHASYCQAVADGAIAPATGWRASFRRVVCVLARTHTAGVPF